MSNFQKIVEGTTATVRFLEPGLVEKQFPIDVDIDSVIANATFAAKIGVGPAISQVRFDGIFYRMVMESLDGSLADLVDQQILITDADMQQIIDLCFTLLRNRKLFLDLHPGNIMYRKANDGTTKRWFLVDFDDLKDIPAGPQHMAQASALMRTLIDQLIHHIQKQQSRLILTPNNLAQRHTAPRTQRTTVHHQSRCPYCGSRNTAAHRRTQKHRNNVIAAAATNTNRPHPDPIEIDPGM